jgi:hypothetical protein
LQIDRVARQIEKGFGQSRGSHGTTPASLLHIPPSSSSSSSFHAPVEGVVGRVEAAVPMVYDASLQHELTFLAILERTIGRNRAESHYLQPRKGGNVSDILLSDSLYRIKGDSFLAGKKKQFYVLAGNVIYQYEREKEKETAGAAGAAAMDGSGGGGGGVRGSAIGDGTSGSSGSSGVGEALSLMLPLADVEIEKTTRKQMGAKTKHALILRHRTPGKVHSSTSRSSSTIPTIPTTPRIPTAPTT